MHQNRIDAPRRIGETGRAHMDSQHAGDRQASGEIDTGDARLAVDFFPVRY